MRRITLFLGLFLVAVLSICAQEWTPEDSLQLRRVLEGEGELKLNPEALKELNNQFPKATLQLNVDKSWLNFDNSLPVIPNAPEKKTVLTLRPYTANTRYNWDPVYQKKIKVNKNTWRGDPFYEILKSNTYSDWAKTPFDKGIRRSREEIEASGLRYTVTDRANNTAVGSWKPAGGGTGSDFMTPFTKEFWSPKVRKRRERTLEVLKTYGDSITVLMKDPALQ